MLPRIFSTIIRSFRKAKQMGFGPTSEQSFIRIYVYIQPVNEVQTHSGCRAGSRFPRPHAAVSCCIKKDV